MPIENLKGQVELLLEEIDKPAEAAQLELEESTTEGEFTEVLEGEVIDNPPQPRGIPIKWLIPVGLASLALALVGVLVIAPLFEQSAAIIITPDIQTITAKGDITVPAKMLVNKTITLSEQVKTTGIAHQLAAKAHGWVTFYNALQSPQDIPAGTLLIGSDGIHVITDSEAYIPAGTLATNGSVTISARASVAGAAGNIQAGDINGACCRDYVFARNGAFSGGMDSRDYQTATSEDIDAANKQLSSLVTTQITTEASKQLSANEAMSPPQCQSQAVSNPALGSEASRVTVSLTSNCIVYAYRPLELMAQEQLLLKQAIADQLGTGYEAKGSISETITRLSLSQGTLNVSLNVTGESTYHFSNDELQMMRQLVTGKSREQATILLLHVRGVHTVGIQIGSDRTTLPGNEQAITISVYEKG